MDPLPKELIIIISSYCDILDIYYIGKYHNINLLTPFTCQQLVNLKYSDRYEFSDTPKDKYPVLLFDLECGDGEKCMPLLCDDTFNVSIKPINLEDFKYNTTNGYNKKYVFESQYIVYNVFDNILVECDTINYYKYMIKYYIEQKFSKVLQKCLGNNNNMIKMNYYFNLITNLVSILNLIYE
jgi:hypothetical protein